MEANGHTVDGRAVALIGRTASEIERAADAAECVAYRAIREPIKA